MAEKVKYITFDTPKAPKLKVNADATPEEIANILKSGEFEDFMVSNGFAYKYGLQPVDMLQPDNLNDNAFVSGVKGAVNTLKSIGTNMMGAIYDTFGATEAQENAKKVYEQYKLDRTAYMFRQQEDGSILPRPNTIEDVLNDEAQFTAFTKYLGAKVGEGAMTSVPIALATIAGSLVGGPIGGTTALLMSSYIFGVGDVYGAQLDAVEGDEDPIAGIAFALGVPYAFAERLFGVSNQFISKTIGKDQFKKSMLQSGAMQDLKNKVAKKGFEYPKNLATSMVKAGAGEYVAESIQETLNITGGEFLQAGKSFEEVYQNKEFLKQIAEAGAAGFFGGFGFGVVSPTVKAFKQFGAKGADPKFKGKFGSFQQDSKLLEESDLEFGDDVSVAGVYNAGQLTGKESDKKIEDPKLKLLGNTDTDFVIGFEDQQLEDGTVSAMFVPIEDIGAIFKRTPKAKTEVTGIEYKYDDFLDPVLEDTQDTRQQYETAKKKLNQLNVIPSATNKSVDEYLDREKQVDEITQKIENDRIRQKDLEKQEQDLLNEPEEEQPIVKPTQADNYLMPLFYQQFEGLEGDKLREAVNKAYPAFRKQQIIEEAGSINENQISVEDRKALSELGFNGPLGEETVQRYLNDVRPVADTTQGMRTLRDIIDNKKRFEDVVPKSDREVEVIIGEDVQVTEPLTPEQRSSITGEKLADPNAKPTYIFNMNISQRFREIRELVQSLDARGWKIAGSPYYPGLTEAVKEKQRELRSTSDPIARVRIRQELKQLKDKGYHILENPFAPKGSPFSLLMIGSPQAIRTAEQAINNLQRDERLNSLDPNVRRPVEEQLAAYRGLIARAMRNRARLNQLLMSLSLEPITNWETFNGTVKGLSALRKRLDQTKTITKRRPIKAKAERWSVMSNAQPRLRETFKDNAIKIAQLLRRRLDALGLSKFQLDVLDRVLSSEGFEVNGKYLIGQRLVQISLNARPDADIYNNQQDATLYTLHHEVIHALKDLGLFTAEEYKSLQEAARTTWIDQFNIKEKYPELSQEEQIEEAISEAFAHYMVNRNTFGSILGRAFQRIKAFIFSLAGALRTSGFNDVTDIFEMIDAGIIGQRDASVQNAANNRTELNQKDLWSTPTQTVSSAETSINKDKKAAAFGTLDNEGVWKEGVVNLDIGGGRFDNVTTFLEGKGVINYIFDPYNRTPAQNNEVVRNAANSQSDTVTINNVLNVIPEEDSANQRRVLLQAKNALKKGGTVYISVYEGNRTGVGKYTSKGYQQNKKTADYLPLVKSVFPNAFVKNGIIRATKLQSDVKVQKMYNDPGASPLNKYVPLTRQERRKYIRNIEKYSKQMKEELDGTSTETTPIKMNALSRFIGHFRRIAADYPVFTPLFNAVQMKNGYINMLTMRFSSMLGDVYLRVKQDPAAAEALNKAHIIAQMTGGRYRRNAQDEIVFTAPSNSSDKNESVKAGETIVLTGDVALAYENYTMTMGMINQQILRDMIAGEYDVHIKDAITFINRFLPGTEGLPDLSNLSPEAAANIIENMKLADGQFLINQLNKIESDINIRLQNRLYTIDTGIAFPAEDLKELDNIRRRLSEGFMTQAQAYEDRIKDDYAPLMRYGTYFISVKDTDGKLIWYEQIESDVPGGFGTERKARGIAEQLKIKYPDAQVSEPTLITIDEIRKIFSKEIDSIDTISGFLSGTNAKQYAELRKEFYKKLKIDIQELKEKETGFVAPFKNFYMPRNKQVGAEGVPGYDPDFTRATLQFISGFANQSAQNRFNKNIVMNYKNVNNYSLEVGDSNLQKAVTRWMDYSDDPAQEWGRTRRLGFWWYLGGNLSSAFLQTISAVQFTGPILAELANPSFLPGVGFIKVTQALGDSFAVASKMVLRGATKGTAFEDALLNLDELPSDVKDAVLRAIADGTIKQGQAIQESGITQMMGGSQAQQAFRVVENTIVGGAFNTFEAFSRIAAFVATMRMSTANPKMLEQAKKLYADNADFQFQIEKNDGVLTPEILARFITNETFGVYGKINRQNIGRGIGAVFGLFMTYVSQMTGMMFKMLNPPTIRKTAEGYRVQSLYPNRTRIQNRVARKTLARMALMILLTGGLFGMPGGEDAEDMYNMMRKLTTGLDSDIRDEFRKMLYEIGFNPQMIEFATAGGFNAFANIDIQRRIGFGNLPWSTQVRAALSTTGLNTGARAEEFLGAAGSVYMSATRSVINDGIREGNYGTMIMNLFPNAIKNVAKGINYAYNGEAYTGYGVVLNEDLGLTEAFMQSMGYTPNKIAKAREALYLEKKVGGATSGYRQRINARITNAYRDIILAQKEGDTSRILKAQAEIQEITKDIMKFNSKVPPHMVFTPDLERLFDQALQAVYPNYRLEKGGIKNYNEKRNIRIRLGLD